MTTDEETLIVNNLGLAYEIAWKFYRKFNGIYELDELQSVAFLGLTKAASTFKKDLGFEFSTYAYNCIQNQIRQYYRDNKKHLEVSYLYEEINDNGVTLEDITASEYDMLEQINKDEHYSKLYKEIDKLKDRYKSIMQYRLQGLTMLEISKILNISQPQVSRDYNVALNILRNKFKDWRDI